MCGCRGHVDKWMCGCRGHVDKWMCGCRGRVDKWICGCRGRVDNNLHIQYIHNQDPILPLVACTVQQTGS